VKQSFFGGRLTVTSGDITRVAADAIVNAANGTLLGGGGVDGAIHRAGGPSILAACQALRAGRLRDGLPTGDAVETTAGALKAKWVIHTVGPVWQGGARGEEELLARCYRRSLEIAEGLGAVSIAFPAISTGVYGYPGIRAARVVWREVADWISHHPAPASILLVFYGEPGAQVFLSERPTA
jgi:O-acetyl-ADP-ribose deacetylase (regulator of RNase III)